MAGSQVTVSKVGNCRAFFDDGQELTPCAAKKKKTNQVESHLLLPECLGNAEVRHQHNPALPSVSSNCHTETYEVTSFR